MKDLRHPKVTGLVLNLLNMTGEKNHADFTQNFISHSPNCRDIANIMYLYNGRVVRFSEVAGGWGVGASVIVGNKATKRL